MLLRSGTTFHSGLFDMEGKLDLIVKVLRDLKFRAEGLENKNKEKSSIDDTRDKREHQ